MQEKITLIMIAIGAILIGINGSLIIRQRSRAKAIAKAIEEEVERIEKKDKQDH